MNLLCEWTVPSRGITEDIIFASFLEDINSDYMIVVTRDYECSRSRFYILRITKNKNFNNKSNYDSSEEDNEYKSDNADKLNTNIQLNYEDFNSF